MKILLTLGLICLSSLAQAADFTITVQSAGVGSATFHCTGER